MPFLSLNPYNFRNLSNERIDLLAREVYFCGENGQGKSNLLEALYYSAYASSFRTRIENEMVRKGENSMRINTLYRSEKDNTHSTVITLSNGNKKIEKDGKVIRDRKELINTIPCVLYNHDDLDFVVGSPERRRFFIDQCLSMYDMMYIESIRRYRRILKSRNMSLKEKRYDLIPAYDNQIAFNGIEIIKKRKNAVFQFNQAFGRIYEQVTGIEGVSIKYIPSWKRLNNEKEVVSGFEDSNIPSIDDVIEIIKSKREVERALCRTMSGPHLDKIVFMKGGSPFVPTASTGQRRLIALLLRNAQAVYYKQMTDKKPVLLMDDVLLELDPEKREKVTALLPDYDQLFCTFLPGEPYEKYRHESTRIYEIKKGIWKEVK